MTLWDWCVNVMEIAFGLVNANGQLKRDNLHLQRRKTGFFWVESHRKRKIRNTMHASKEAAHRFQHEVLKERGVMWGCSLQAEA